MSSSLPMPRRRALSAAASAIVVIGVAGSGKTTLAQALAHHCGHAFVDADDFHTPDARGQMASGAALTDAQREPWVGELAHELRRLAHAGRSSVLAFSGLRAAHRQRLRDSGVPVRFVYLHAPPAVLAGRLAARRGHFMPMQLLESQLDALELPTEEADVIAVDVDGGQAQVLARVMSALALG